MSLGEKHAKKFQLINGLIMTDNGTHVLCVRSEP